MRIISESGVNTIFSIFIFCIGHFPGFYARPKAYDSLCPFSLAFSIEISSSCIINVHYIDRQVSSAICISRRPIFSIFIFCIGHFPGFYARPKAYDSLCPFSLAFSIEISSSCIINVHYIDRQVSSAICISRRTIFSFFILCIGNFQGFYARPTRI